MKKLITLNKKNLIMRMYAKVHKFLPTFKIKLKRYAYLKNTIMQMNYFANLKKNIEICMQMRTNTYITHTHKYAYVGKLRIYAKIRAYLVKNYRNI